MKRIPIFILAFLYLAITSGVPVNVHYCMGEVASVKYGHATTTACSTCGMEEKEGCCSTETSFVKASEQQKTTTSFALITPAPAIVPTDFSNGLAGQIVQSGIVSRLNHSPPLRQLTSLNILYSNFRI